MTHILKDKPSNIPENAVKISETDAIEQQWKFIMSWKPQRDVWPFTYGTGSLGVVASMSSLVISGHYNRKLNLKHHGKIAMMGPIALVGAVMAPLLHQQLVSGSILLMNDCPVCIQLRSMVLQNAIAIAYPFTVATISSFMMSTARLTYPLPLLSMSTLPELFSIWKKITLPLKSRLLYLAAFNTLMATFMTDREAKSLFYVISEANQRQKY